MLATQLDSKCNVVFATCNGMRRPVFRHAIHAYFGISEYHLIVQRIHHPTWTQMCASESHSPALKERNAIVQEREAKTQARETRTPCAKAKLTKQYPSLHYSSAKRNIKTYKRKLSILATQTFHSYQNRSACNNMHKKAPHKSQHV